jgi:hypothetical protein
MAHETTELFRKVLVRVLLRSTSTNAYSMKALPKYTVKYYKHSQQSKFIGENAVSFVKQDGTFHSAQMA